MFRNHPNKRTCARGELREGGQHQRRRGSGGHHLVGDASEDLDHGRDGGRRAHQGLELAEHLAAAHLHGADLGDAALGRAAAGGLEVDDDEGDRGQRGAQVVEGALHHGGDRGRAHVADARCHHRQTP